MNKLRRALDLIRQKRRITEAEVQIGAGYRINGVPLFKVEKHSVMIGTKFLANSNDEGNPIGYANPLSFWTLDGGKIRIGDNVGMSNAAVVAYGADVDIGNNVLIGGGVKIYTSDFHSVSSADRMSKPEKGIKHSSVKIGDNVFIGSGSIVLKGVTIGEHAVIGAGSVVTKDVPANEIWAGNPARFIRKVF